MTPQRTFTAPTKHTSLNRTARLRLKPGAVAQGGRLDGAWWPHSGDLGSELPDLLAVLSVRLGRIDRVLYNVAEWPNAPTKLATGGRRVRLDGYRRQPANTVEIVGLDRARVVLLTVPADTDPAEAHCALRTAARLSDRSTALDILIAAQHAD
jgi:hypothetical protein